MPDVTPEPTPATAMPPAPPGWVRLTTESGGALVRADRIECVSPTGDYTPPHITTVAAWTRVETTAGVLYASHSPDEVVALVIAAEQARRTTGPSFTLRPPSPPTVDAIAALREVDQYWALIWGNPEHYACIPDMRAVWRRVQAVLKAAGVTP